jgi:hypothetical protein
MTDDADEFIEFLSVDTNEKFIEWARDRLEGLQHLALEYGGDPGFIYTQDGQSYCYVPASRIEGAPVAPDLKAELTMPMLALPIALAI